MSTQGAGAATSSWITTATSTPALLFAISCATMLLLLASILTILVLLSRLRRSEKTIASLHLQLSSLAVAAYSLSAASAAAASAQHDDRAKYYFYDTVGRGGTSRQCSMAFDTAPVDDTLVAHHSQLPHHYAGSASGVDNRCSSCFDSHLTSSLARRPPTMTSALSFRPLGRHSVSSASPPTACTTTSVGGASPPQAADVSGADWAMLPSTPTTRAHALLPPAAADLSLLTYGPEQQLPTTTSDHRHDPHAHAWPVPPHDPHVPSPSRMTRSNRPPPLQLPTSTLIAAGTSSLAPPAPPPPAPFAPAPAPVPAHPLGASPDPATSDALLNRHPSVHSDTHAPSFWLQLPPADASTTDLPHAPPPEPAGPPREDGAVALSATLHLGSTDAYAVAAYDTGVGRAGVDLSDVTAVAVAGDGDVYRQTGSVSRPGTAESCAAGSERDAFLSGGGDHEVTVVVGDGEGDVGGCGLGGGAGYSGP